jgi:hypothetical protein
LKPGAYAVRFRDQPPESRLVVGHLFREQAFASSILASPTVCGRSQVVRRLVVAQPIVSSILTAHLNLLVWQEASRPLLSVLTEFDSRRGDYARGCARSAGPLSRD